MKHKTNDWHACAPSSQSACSSGCWSFFVVDAAGSVGQIQLSSAAKGLRTTQAKGRLRLLQGAAQHSLHDMSQPAKSI